MMVLSHDRVIGNNGNLVVVGLEIERMHRQEAGDDRRDGSDGEEEIAHERALRAQRSTQGAQVHSSRLSVLGTVSG